MPQMDILILSSQTSFLLLFWLGYFVFMKTILPLVSMELKLKQKIVLSNISWFKKHLADTLFFRAPYGVLLVKVRSMMSSIHSIVAKRNLFFGVYSWDLLFFKKKASV